METLHPTSFLPNSSWVFQGSNQSSTEWTKEENKKFEYALAIFDETTPNRWARVAEMIPGKTVYDVFKQYKELEEDVCDIEAGRVPIPPGYFSSSDFAFDLVDDRDSFRKKPQSARGASDHERKKGVPWTKDEHRRFLLGLLKYGKGDWRNISRNFVVTKTPTQVASHAQKYFLRQHSGVKEKRRPSIHDFTTINLTESSSPSENNANVTFWDQSSVIPPLQMYSEEAQKVLLDWNIPSEEALMVLGSTCGDLFMSSPYNVSSPNGLKLPLDQNLYAGARYAARTKPQASMFELQTSGYY
ncbi:hypothetical protein TIFTF001_010576 [Ficus carica]|uniref:MYB transcription factor n=1 Tax=Ficus carica TaxID=3494 RepID=A0AA88ACH1_FICCA|nr:hypothetical protein TIFTF001_010576 [Ficus carica]